MNLRNVRTGCLESNINKVIAITLIRLSRKMSMLGLKHTHTKTRQYFIIVGQLVLNYQEL